MSSQTIAAHDEISAVCSFYFEVTVTSLAK